jgi:phage tail-like protein
MADQIDPYRAYSFKLDIAGVTEGHFTECSNLGIRVTPIAYREAGGNQVVRHIPGPVQYAEVTLRYGLTASHQLWDWMQSALNGRVERKNASIVLLDSSGASEVMRWNLVDAWPVEWRSAGFDAMSREIAIESITLVFDSLERA